MSSHSGARRGHHWVGSLVLGWVGLLVLGFAIGAAADEPKMRAHFIDVGQADAALLEFPCGAMMIDVGAQDDAHQDRLRRHLDEFFSNRTDLVGGPQNDRKGILELVVITHTHLDHNSALRAVAGRRTIRRYVHNGRLNGSGRANASWAVEEPGRVGTVRHVLDSQIQQLPTRRGLSDEVIDPFGECDGVDPQVRVLSGGMDENPGWVSGEFDNGNNHSLVVRVDFGEASFLFSGDLEEPAIETLVDWYAGTGMLDVDVYQVGHHGSHNGTTRTLVDAMTPEVAVLSMGRWFFGREPFKRFSTWAYGHPRKDVVVELERGIKRRRSQSRTVKVGTAGRTFSSRTVRDAIYATGWDGTVVVTATSSGRLRVTRER